MKKLKVNLRKKIALTDWVKVVLLCDALHPRIQKIKNRASNLRLPTLFFGAGGGGRTRTLLPGLDFESSTSANSITPANKRAKQFYYLAWCW